MTFFSGISDESDHVRLGGYPGAFRDLLGVRVEEFFPLLTGETVTLSEGTGRVWSEDVTATSAEVLSTYAGGPLRGRPAITRRTVGSGSAWYLSTLPDDQTLAALLEQVTGAAGVVPAADVSPGVEVVRRRGDGRSWLFLANDTGTDQTVAVTGHDLVADQPVGPVVLAPGAVAVVREA